MSDGDGHRKVVDSFNESGGQGLPGLKFDPDRYREHLANIELDEAQQNELLQVLWDIMSTMVNIGWGVDSVQLVMPELFNLSCTEDKQITKEKESEE